MARYMKTWTVNGCSKAIEEFATEKLMCTDRVLEVGTTTYQNFGGKVIVTLYSNLEWTNKLGQTNVGIHTERQEYDWAEGVTMFLAALRALPTTNAHITTNTGRVVK